MFFLVVGAFVIGFMSGLDSAADRLVELKEPVEQAPSCQIPD